MSAGAVRTTEADHGRLQARLWPMRGTSPVVRNISAGRGFRQSLRCGHYELAADVAVRTRLRAAFGRLGLLLPDAWQPAGRPRPWEHLRKALAELAGAGAELLACRQAPNALRFCALTSNLTQCQSAEACGRA